MTLTVGDTVRLKSGGPRMTVERFFKTMDGSERIRCVWFDDCALESADFPKDALLLPVLTQEKKPVGNQLCDDCGLLCTPEYLTTKDDHHGGEKTVCKDRDSCHGRAKNERHGG